MKIFFINVLLNQVYVLVDFFYFIELGCYYQERKGSSEEIDKEREKNLTYCCQGIIYTSNQEGI